MTGNQQLGQQLWMHTPQVKAVFEALDGQARFVGGCVRNALLGQDITDIDIATPLPPTKVISRLEEVGIKIIPTGLKHGTVTAVVDGQPFEITTLRRDVACHGRHAEVEFTDSWEEDASRRDFTFNAMSCAQDGQLFDYFNGWDDLKQGRVRFVGDALQRCREDYLRILRFFRFFAYYGTLPFDEEALAACVQNAAHLKKLSAERVQTEMFKLLTAPAVLGVLKVMQDTNILGMLIAGEVDMVVLERFLGLEKEFSRKPDPVVRLAMLVRTMNTPDEKARELSADWRLSGRDTRRLELFAAPPCEVVPAMSEAEQKKAIRATDGETFQQLVLLQWAVGDVEAVRRAYVPMMELATDWEVPDFPLTGADIISLGIKEGKKVGQLLNQAQAQWEESDYQLSRKELLGYVKQLSGN